MLDSTISFTPATYETAGILTDERAWSDHQKYGDISIRLDWEARLELAGPRTLTQFEVGQLMERFAEEHLRSKCMRMVLAMPDEILPFVCPQLEEMVSYEWSMLLEREANRRPAIRESWGALPGPA